MLIFQKKVFSGMNNIKKYLKRIKGIFILNKPSFLLKLAEFKFMKKSLKYENVREYGIKIFYKIKYSIKNV